MLQPERLTRIVDIGASPINPAPYDMLLGEGFAEVIGFEPQPEPYQDLMRDPVPHRTVLPYAVGDGEDAVLNVCKASGFTSLLTPNPNFLDYAGRWRRMMRVVENIPVATHRLDDITEIADFDLLKIDIQGGEQAVFENGLKKLAEAIVVYTEVAFVPMYDGQPLLDKQMGTLRALGFDLHKFVSFSHLMLHTELSSRLRPRGHRNQPVDGDAVFIRNLLALDQLPRERLKHLAILSDAVFHSHDLTLKILEMLKRPVGMSDVAIDTFVSLLPDRVT